VLPVAFVAKSKAGTRESELFGRRIGCIAANESACISQGDSKALAESD
jgi:hypothetical protein